MLVEQSRYWLNNFMVSRVEHFCPAPTSTVDSIPLDGELLEGIREGNDEALAHLYARHSRVVYAIALRMLREHSAAEDIVQEVFMQIWRKPPELQEGSCRLNGWVAIVTKNRCLSVIRQQVIHPSVSTDGFDFASTEDLGHKTERHQMYDKAGEMVEALSTEQRQILDMCFVQGMTHSSVAASTGLPLGTVKTRVRSALHTLRGSLEAKSRGGRRVSKSY